MSYEAILYEVEDGILTITANRPEKLNALDLVMIDELKDAFIKAAEDDEVKGVIVTGAGDKAFIAGADIEDLHARDMLAGKEVTQAGQSLLWHIELLRKPVIAAVNGYALGGGCEIALACHMRFVSSKATLGLPEVKLGIIPGFGGTQRLPRLIGKGRALELILTGNFIDPEEAYRLGLANKIFEPDELMPACRKTLGTIAKRAPLATRYAIEAVNRGMEMTLQAGQQMEADMFGILCGTEDKNEGTRAFMDKRDPQWKCR